MPDFSTLGDVQLLGEHQFPLDEVKQLSLADEEQARFMNEEYVIVVDKDDKIHLLKTSRELK